MPEYNGLERCSASGPEYGRNTLFIYDLPLIVMTLPKWFMDPADSIDNFL